LSSTGAAWAAPVRTALLRPWFRSLLDVADLEVVSVPTRDECTVGHLRRVTRVTRATWALPNV
jgi:hypothetical protein